jgi:hypothetical protein
LTHPPGLEVSTNGRHVQTRCAPLPSGVGFRPKMPERFARGRRASWAPGFSVAAGRLAGVWTDPVTGVETVRVYRVIELGS